MVADWRAFNFSCIGASHIKSGAVCQDYSFSCKTPDCVYAVVCDGHGGEDYFRSDRGSRFAARVFGECAADTVFLQKISRCQTDKQRTEGMTQLIKSIIARWNALVDEDIEKDPFSVDELQGVSYKARLRYENQERMQAAYGTTLLGVVIAASFWFGIQIGDGKCVAISEKGEPAQPIPWDDNCFLNVTTSLCDENALKEFRVYFSNAIPAAVFLGSDGIDDCFAGDERLYDFYRVALKSFAQLDEAAAFEQLQEYLPKLSAMGSGDDMSVAILLSTNIIRTGKALYNKPKRLFLQITRDGNFGGDKPSDCYYQTAEAEAIPGIYELEQLGCGGFYGSRSNFEIVSVCSQKIELRVEAKAYVVTLECPVKITQTDIAASYDGPHFVAYDTLEFCVIEK